MDRRTFHKVIGLGMMGSLAGGTAFGAQKPATDLGADALEIGNPEGFANIPERKTAWPSQTYRRLLIDTHVPDWDHLLSVFNAAEYVSAIAKAGFQSLEQYANSHVGLCLWRTKLGQMHRGMNGRDYFGEVMEECRRHGLHRVAYYSLIFDDWAYQTHPDWRILPEDGYDSELFSRTGMVCPNSPYRDFAFACVQELVANYDFECIFLDQPFWPTICYCPHCAARFWREQNNELPRIVDWKDPVWRAFQRSRQKWLEEFMMTVRETVKKTRPITVYFNFATIFAPWQQGTSLEQGRASDFCGGDFYGGPTESSLVCKTYAGLTLSQPFEVMTSRASPSLIDFENTKPFEELVLETMVPAMHSAAFMLIDAIKPMGTLNGQFYEFVSHVNAQHDAYEPFLGGELQADVAIYFDKTSMYDPDLNGVPASVLSPNLASSHSGPRNLGIPAAPPTKVNLPHLEAVIGTARILREGHIPYGVVTNITLDQLSRFRAVFLPNVLEMTEEQANHFREFVRNGGVLYASGVSSLSAPELGDPRFLLEDVLGVRYLGGFGESVTFLSPASPEIAKVIWPQENITLPWSMVRAQSLPGAEVLATATLPFVAPNAGYAVGAHFAQIWSNPPAAKPGSDPGIVVNSFGKGKAIWIAGRVESLTEPVGHNLVKHLLRNALPGPYRFEADTNRVVEVTVFDQPEQHRLLIGLINLQEHVPTIPVSAVVRVLPPSGRRVRRVLQLPEQKPLSFEKSGAYLQFEVEPFKLVFMAVAEYE